ncbi:MAG: LamG domain-containing protein [Phycisphaerae bacterium]|nr:LamG domain-containing protein [Phycisphaerae bacterium]
MCKRSICLVPVILAMVVTSYASADLLGYWNLDEDGGIIAEDSSGNGHDGTINGATWTTGKVGSALDFDGVDDYVLCAERVGTGPGVYPESLMPQTFTVSCWTKLDNFAYFSSFVGNGMDTGGDECGFFLYNWGWVDDNEQDFGLAIRTETAMSYVETPNIYQPNTWYHLAATYDGQDVRIYVDGALAVGPTNVGGPIRWISADSGNYPERFAIGVWLDPGYDLWVDGIIDEVGYWSDVLSEAEVRKLAGLTKATEPNPADGALYPDTWVNLQWMPGAYADSHDVYFGDTFDDVNDGTIETFRGKQTSASYIVGFPGFAFPEGLVPGTTYYWRIDEVNDADPNSPWTGDIWSFLIPPKTAYDPDPADGAEFVDPNATFTWTPGFDAKLHTVYIGTSFDDVNDAAGGTSQAAAAFSPGPLEQEKVYYWRVDEFDVVETHKGDVWGFTTPGAAASLEPINGSANVQINTTLIWAPATTANSHDLYFGTNKALVQSATTASPQYKGNRSIGSESYEPDGLALLSEYFWRVDAVYGTGTVKGLVWNFTTADFLLVDDFESYNDIDPPDPASNRIFDKWIDGFGTTTNCALVGNDLPPYAEQSTVHGGTQSMPFLYDNASKTCEATLTLVWPRDWTTEGVTKLSLWFRGDTANAAARMFVALNGASVVYHDDPAATQTTGWTEWIIDLVAFGSDLTNVNTITIGIGTKNAPSPTGGTGTVHFDDIGLIR